jgi:hypothetical protein
MKIKTIVGCITAALFLSVAGTALFAQNGPGPNGRGYGGPPQSQEERTARQASCLQANGGVCPNGGPRPNCPGRGMGQGNGAGQGWRHGLRDGTGPRSASGTCPLNNSAQSQK